ncbi:MAG: ATP-binding protein, partial [Candidatus Thiodiazotropha sp. (ex Lucinoma annulata)]|nr:ATP-binding protein [Candidatus Thiodiazotropha sp. (ex Lucinoma annulata)]
LEGVHFSVVAAIAARIAETKTFTQDSLLFCPTREFVNLRHGSPYKNQSNFGYLRVYAEDEDDELSCTIKIYRGRNEGNVGCDLSGSVSLRQIISGNEKPFSIYVPGLSGIPQVEEFRTESIVRRGVASGDANLYLRNVIYLIEKKGKLEELTSLMKTLFPSIYVTVSFNPEQDLYIDVRVSVTGPYGRKVPLELVGTGVQQALQILSYVVLFRPYILLLDEPDSHLHPDNQGLLAKAMLAIASETETNIIATTHSRHLVDALYDESNIVWLKEGKVFQQGDNIGRIPLLMDIGALDSFERLRDGLINWVFLTEDANMDLIERLALSAGYTNDEFVVYSYKTSTNMQSALLLAEFICEIAPNTKIVIHRDQDFMTDDEEQWVSALIDESGAIPFITEGSDVESYYINPEHLATLLEEDPQDIANWQTEIAQTNHNELLHKFTRKRDELKQLYRKRDINPPDTLALIGNDNPVPPEKRVGKYMLRKIRADMHTRYGKTVDVRNETEFLQSAKLQAIRNDNMA